MRFQATLARTRPSAAGHGRLSREISCSADRRARVNALRPSALGPMEGEREEREKKEGTPAKKNERGAVEGVSVHRRYEQEQLGRAPRRIPTA